MPNDLHRRKRIRIVTIALGVLIIVCVLFYGPFARLKKVRRLESAGFRMLHREYVWARCVRFLPRSVYQYKDPTTLVFKVPYFDEATLVKLNQLSGVHMIFFYGVSISDSHLSALEGLEGLKTLIISRSDKLTDAGMVYVGEMRSLEVLRIRRCKNLTDKGLETLDNLGNLKILEISRISVTNDGLQFLARLENIEEISLEKTEVTSIGVDELRKLLPSTEIRFIEGSPSPSEPEPASIKQDTEIPEPPTQ